MVHLAPHSTLNTSTSSLSPTSPVLLSSSSPNPDLLSTHRQRPSDTFCCTRKAWCACCAASASISCSSHAGSTATNHPAKLVFAGSVPGQLPGPGTCHKKVSASTGASRRIPTNSVSAASVNVATGVCPVASWMWASLEGINVQVIRLKGGVRPFGFRVQVFFFVFVFLFLFLYPGAQNMILLASIAARYLVTFLTKKNILFEPSWRAHPLEAPFYFMIFLDFFLIFFFVFVFFFFLIFLHIRAGQR